MRTRYFHEEDYCQQELLPLSAWDRCAQQLEVDLFSTSYRTESGWSDIHVRQDAEAKLIDLGISAEHFGAAIAVHLPRFDAITSGFSAPVEPRPNMLAFGLDEGFSVFIVSGDHGKLETCSIDTWDLQLADIDRIVAMFTQLPCADRLLFADWLGRCMFRVNDTVAWRRYLEVCV